MRGDSKANIKQDKVNARNRYAERKINSFVKWSFDTRGKVLYKELVELQTQYGIKCYG